MPSLQTVNFGENPLNTSLRNIASGFIDKFNSNQDQKRNDEIFNRILSKYPKGTSPTDIYKDMLTAQGLDPAYKKDRITELKDFVTLSAKSDKTPYQQAILDQRKDDYNLKVAKDNRQIDADKINAQAKENTNKENHLKFVKNYTKEEQKNLSDYEKADFMRMISKAEDNAKLAGEEFDIDVALAYTLNNISTKKKDIADAVVTNKPWTAWGEPNKDKLDPAKEKLFDELMKLYDKGITRQLDLTKIAERGKWSKAEIADTISKVYQANGKKSKANNKTEQQLADEIFQ